MLPQPGSEPPIKIGGQWRPFGQGPSDDVEVRVAYSSLHIPANTEWHSGVTLDAIWIMREEGGWRLTLKGRRGERPVVAYFHEKEFRDLIALAATTVDCGSPKWWPDNRPIRVAW